MNRQCKWGVGVLLAATLTLAACRPQYEVVAVESRRLAVDASLEGTPQARKAARLIEPYKQGFDDVMHTVLGTAEKDMPRDRPESLLTNLVAEMLRQEAARTLGHAADMGLMNVGGLRSDLSKGDITTGTAYEVLPFENSLCVLTLKGSDLLELFRNIARRGGEGVSGVRLVIDGKGNLLESSIQGQPVDENKTYTIGTIDYLAEGNDGLVALTKAVHREDPEGLVLRLLFMDYVKREAAAGRSLTADLDGRITVKK